ncbi:MAG: glycosyltransferase family 9 protein [Candidatus Omnitrophica bacterium]|nr:glycosyltransferase family 9 protein [Candidatus Omnitrophota bacterium]
MKWFSQYRYKAWYRRLGVFLFDLAGSLIYGRLFFQPRRFDPKKIKNILLIRNDQLGDLLLTAPALSLVKKSFPDSTVDLLVAAECASLGQKITGIHRTIPFVHHWFSKSGSGEMWREAKQILNQLRRNHYDLAIDFRGDIRNIWLMKEALIPIRVGYGLTGGSFWLTHSPRYDFKAHQTEVNFQLLKSMGIEAPTDRHSFSYAWGERKDLLGKIPPAFFKPGMKRIVIHPGAGYPSKQWPHKHFSSLIKKILEHRLGKLILIGTQAEKSSADFSSFPASEMIDLRGMTNLEELPVLLNHADLFIGQDSGPSHLAALQGLPLVILFSGANNQDIWKPWSNHMTLLTHPVPCSPCESRECPLIHHDCMNKIDPEEVYKAVEQALLEQNQGAKK